jgi:hypothetical protein
LDDINWKEEIKYDPVLRKKVDDYHPNLQERVRRKYLENGLCQPQVDDYHPNLQERMIRKYYIKCEPCQPHP